MDAHANDDDVISFAAGLALLDVSRSAAYTYMGDPQSDFLRPFRVGGRWKYRRRDIQDYLALKARQANEIGPELEPAQLAAAMSAVAAMLEGAPA